MKLTDQVVATLRKIAGEENIRLSEPMKLHTTFKIGGNADIYITPDLKYFPEVVRLLSKEQIPYQVVGNGSNLLVSDYGIDGAVISTHGWDDISVEGDVLRAQAGAMLSRVANTALEHELAGLEFAAGIPGSFGGAVYMNAGAYGGEMKDIITSVTVYHNREVKEISGSECRFGYRSSVFQKDAYTILNATMKLRKGAAEQIAATMKDLARRRQEKQPLDMPSAGSVFKRPEGYYAGALIEQAGLKGFQIGGAAVSEKHSGFIVNCGGATARDVMELIAAVKEKVKANSGVELQEEIRMIGRRQNSIN
ncbi:MAG: UDP-N-acetylmuramate dehydrogenase [Clostridia bacterium]|nr:UDP-N-acetylmuramate dehydrogenase [Clostridia bacterium]